MIVNNFFIIKGEIMNKLLLKSLLIIMSLFGMAPANAASEICYKLNYKEICFPLFYLELPWPLDDDWNEFVDITKLSDDLINPQAIKNIVTFNTLSVMANRLSPRMGDVIQEDLRHSVMALRLPPAVDLVENTDHKIAGSWSLSFRASNGRNILASIPLMELEPDPVPWKVSGLRDSDPEPQPWLVNGLRDSEPEPLPWLVDESLDPQIAQNLLTLASMDAIATYLSDELKTHFKTRFQQATLDLDLPDDVFLKFH